VFAELEFHGEECSGVLLAPQREDNFTGRMACSADPTWQIFLCNCSAAAGQVHRTSLQSNKFSHALFTPNLQDFAALNLE
jgi:hypothetical protein